MKAYYTQKLKYVVNIIYMWLKVNISYIKGKMCEDVNILYFKVKMWKAPRAEGSSKSDCHCKRPSHSITGHSADLSSSIKISFNDIRL